MPQARTRFETAQADRYLGQMVKHFAHKIPAQQSGRMARCAFPVGTADMVADDAGLDIVIDSASDEDLARGKAVVEDHLLRFAFREEPAALTWTA